MFTELLFSRKTNNYRALVANEFFRAAMHFQNANVHNEFAQRVCVCVSVCMHAYMYVLMHINVYESGCGARCRGKVCVKKDALFTARERSVFNILIVARVRRILCNVIE